MSENLFLGGRYFADYYYLTCSLMHFCCSQEDAPSSVRQAMKMEMHSNGNLKISIELCLVPVTRTVGRLQK